MKGVSSMIHEVARVATAPCEISETKRYDRIISIAVLEREG